MTVTESPGFCDCVNPIRSSDEATAAAPSFVTTSPVFRPAAALGPPAITLVSFAPTGLVESPSWEPMYAWRAGPPATSCGAIERTVFDGITKPTPLLSAGIALRSAC